MRRCRLPFFVFVIVGLGVTAWATGVAACFTVCSICGLFGGTGLWGVLAFIALFAAGQLLRVPGPVFVATASGIRQELGTLVALLGALVSVTVSFAVIRTFAGTSRADVHWPLVQRLLRRLDSRPVMTVALPHLTFQTAPLLNYALPMTVVCWCDHLLGSMLGLPVPVAVMPWLSAWVLHRIA